MTDQNQALTKRSADMSVTLEKMKPELAKALGTQVPVDYWCRVFLTTFRKNPLVQQCSLPSLMASMLDIAQLRLMPDNLLGEAYLVPFWNSKQNSYEATTMIGYKGLLKMVRRNRDVSNVTADIVYENDKFIYRKGSKHVLEHEPLLVGDRGRKIGAYAYISYREGGEDFEFVDVEYIEKVKRASRGSDKDSSPWNQWPDGMWKKTALRQLCKTADISIEVEEALARDMGNALDIEAEVMPQAQAPAESSLARAAREQLPPPQPQQQMPQQQAAQPAPVAAKRKAPSRKSDLDYAGNEAPTQPTPKPEPPAQQPVEQAQAEMPPEGVSDADLFNV